MVMRNKIRHGENRDIKNLDAKFLVLNEYLEGREYEVLSIDPFIFEVNNKWIRIDGPWPEKSVFEKILASPYDSIRISFRNQLIIPRR